MTAPTTSDQGEKAACPDCAKALAKYNRLDDRMARRGNFGIVPLPKRCKVHQRELIRAAAHAKGKG